MCSLMDASYGTVESIVDHDSLLWLSDVFDLEDLAAFDLNGRPNIPYFDSAVDQYNTSDWSSNKWDILPELHCFRESPPFQSPLTEVPVNNINTGTPHPNSQNSASHTYKDCRQPASKSDEQKDSSRVKKRQSARQQGPRTPHRVVERRYRNNLNAQIDLLASKLPNSRDGSEDDDPDSFPKNKSKADIMTGAISHIKTLEDSRMRSDAFVRVLEAQIAGFQKLLSHDKSSMIMRSF